MHACNKMSVFVSFKRRVSSIQSITCFVKHPSMFVFVVLFAKGKTTNGLIKNKREKLLKDGFRKSLTGKRRKTGRESRFNYDMPSDFVEQSVEAPEGLKKFYRNGSRRRTKT